MTSTWQPVSGPKVNSIVSRTQGELHQCVIVWYLHAIYRRTYSEAHRSTSGIGPCYFLIIPRRLSSSKYHAGLDTADRQPTYLWKTGRIRRMRCQQGSKVTVWRIMHAYENHHLLGSRDVRSITRRVLIESAEAITQPRITLGDAAIRRHAARQPDVENDATTTKANISHQSQHLPSAQRTSLWITSFTLPYSARSRRRCAA